jgi:hypothetical protein
MDELTQILELIEKFKDSLGVVWVVVLIGVYKWGVVPVRKHYQDFQDWVALYLESHQEIAFAIRALERAILRDSPEKDGSKKE